MAEIDEKGVDEAWADDMPALLRDVVPLAGAPPARFLPRRAGIAAATERGQAGFHPAGK